MFLKNAWYVAAMGSELGPAPLARTICGEPVVLYRTGAGVPVALHDRCAHRGAPLARGRVVGETLQCGYHGLQYDRGGQCVHVPGQSAVPLGARVRSYPLVEKWTWLWLWMGDPAAADESLLPQFHYISDPGWSAKGERLHVGCDYRYMIDNLLDLSHLSFLHERTIGNAAVAESAAVKTERLGEGGVRVTRWMFDVPPPPTYVKAGHLTGNIDRWQIIDWTAPGYVAIDLGGMKVGTGAREGRREGAMLRRSLNALTPETATSCHYFWADAQSFALNDPAVTELMFEQVHATFVEDIAMVEAQQIRRDQDPGFGPTDINADGGGIEARRILDRLAASEATGPARRRSA